MKDGSPRNNSGPVDPPGRDNTVRRGTAAQKQIERDLKKARDDWRNIFESISDSVIILSPDHRIEDANLATMRMLKLAKKQILGRRCYEIFHCTDHSPEGCPHERLISSGKPQTVEMEMEIFGGTFLTTVSPVLDEHGRILRTLHIAKDITDRKKDQHKILRQRAELDAINRLLRESILCRTDEEVARVCLSVAETLTKSGFGFVCEINKNGRLDTLAISDPGWSACRMPRTNAVRMLNDLEVRGIRGKVITANRAIIFNQPASDPEWAGTPKGHPTVEAFLGVPLRQADKTFGMIGLANKPGGYEQADLEAIQGLSGAFVEVLTAKRTEMARDLLNAELNSKNVELEQILHVTSHDLRSPLVNIRGFAQEMENSCRLLSRAVRREGLESTMGPEELAALNKDIPEALGYICAGVKKMDMLLSGLLRLARVGRAAVAIKRLDMKPLVSDVIASMEYQIEAAGAQVQVDLLPPCRGDAQQINQVFSNLLDNAVKHLDENRPGLISITGEKRDGNSVYCVEDNGVGIAPEHRDMIFEIFHRLEPQRCQGDGLGLTIVKRILTRQNGKVWVESQPGKGSKFFVSLPAA